MNKASTLRTVNSATAIAMNNLTKAQTIQAALIKYPKARKMAVVNVSTWYQGTWDDALNLRMDAKSYKWNSDTIEAIKYVHREYQQSERSQLGTI